jgi:poly-gamma-glutamate system protein
MKRPPVAIPRWLSIGLGLFVLVGLALMTLKIVPTPRWPAWPSTTARMASGDMVVVAARAETRMRQAVRVVYDAKKQAGAFIDQGGPPDEVALVGSELTPLVTTLGSLDAKRVAASPAWAHRLTLELARAGITRGSVVGANFSGSFPGLNLAVVCASYELGAELVATTSVTASTFGATDPGFTWPEIEVLLVRRGLIRPVSAAISVGGDGDRGLDLEPEARELAWRIARTSAAALGAVVLAPSSHRESVQRRLDLFERARGQRRLAAFINVGGTESSLGHSDAVLRLENGWLPPVPFDSSEDAGLVAKMVAQGTPVLHLLNVRNLALRWGITH